MSAPLPASVFFYCAPQGPPEHAAYQHCTVCLAEGFRELGVEVVGDVDYWRLGPGSSDHLIEPHPDVTHADSPIVIVNESWLLAGRDLPPGLFASGRRYATVFIDASDGLDTVSRNPELRQFDLILKTHANSRFSYPNEIKPWAFGLSNRILAGIAAAPDPGQRADRLLFNFRVPSPVRTKAYEALKPLGEVLPFDERIDGSTDVPADDGDRIEWEQSGRRHHPAFYARLVASSACAAFGGWLLSPWPDDPARRSVAARVLRNLPFGSERILQFDSWRFWESLAAGCATFHVDLERYGAVLPVMPENLTHYAGLDLERPEQLNERLRSEPELVSRIGRAGRAWALEHYAPAPTARRLLALLDA